jgi:hypothetical protein
MWRSRQPKANRLTASSARPTQSNSVTCLANILSELLMMESISSIRSAAVIAHYSAMPISAPGDLVSPRPAASETPVTARGTAGAPKQSRSA